jgi:hypothetical protein
MYQLGTAYLALADMADGPRHVARESRRKDRVMGRRALWNAATLHSNPSLRAQAWINLGNDLLASGRYPEAYSAYLDALEQAPGHPVASGYAASTLLRWSRASGSPSGNVIAMAHYWAKVAQSNLATADSIAAGSSRLFSRLPTDRADEAVPLSAADFSGYDAFVARYRLYLSWALDGADHPSCWDGLNPPPISSPIDGPAAPPPIFSMLNSLKADFLLARRLAWEGIESLEDDAHHYVDTLDYAAYGDGVSRVLLAARSALDVLDRVAVAANHYFGIGLEPHDTHFRKAWRTPERPRELRPVVEDEIAAGNIAMCALAEMADDLSQNGWLEGRQRFRNLATHRFVVAHVEGIDSQSTPEIEHVTVQQLDEEAVTALSVARSALLYLYGAIGNHEQRLARGPGVSLAMDLPRSIIKPR